MVSNPVPVLKTTLPRSTTSIFLRIVMRFRQMSVAQNIRDYLPTEYTTIGHNEKPAVKVGVGRQLDWQGRFRRRSPSWNSGRSQRTCTDRVPSPDRQASDPGLLQRKNASS